jgi:hypothetical protein
MDAERRLTPDGPWVSIDRWVDGELAYQGAWKDEHTRPSEAVLAAASSVVHDALHRGEDFEDIAVPVWERIYAGRDYDLFGLLAGVRSQRLAPIARARGLPTDTCVEIRAHAAQLGSDGHTHSWLTLAELRAHTWEVSGRKVGGKPTRFAYFTTRLEERLASQVPSDPTGTPRPDWVRIVFWFDN